MTIDNCHKHVLELAVDECRECRHGYCDDCLVYVQAPKSRPMCLQCALAISGIRRSGRPERRSWRQKRQDARLARIRVPPGG